MFAVVLAISSKLIEFSLGYDHADPDEEKVMFALQEKIVKEWSQQ